MIKLAVESRAFYLHSTHYGTPGLDELTFFADDRKAVVQMERRELRNALKAFTSSTKILVWMADIDYSGSDVHLEYFVFDELTVEQILTHFAPQDELMATVKDAQELLNNNSFGEHENRTTSCYIITTVGELLRALNKRRMWNEDHDEWA